VPVNGDTNVSIQNFSHNGYLYNLTNGAVVTVTQANINSISIAASSGDVLYLVNIWSVFVASTTVP